MATAHIRKSAR